MIPASFVVLEALPLTRNGKLDRAALAAIKGSAVTRGYVAPRTAEEIILCEVVAQLFGGHEMSTLWQDRRGRGRSVQSLYARLGHCNAGRQCRDDCDNQG